MHQIAVDVTDYEAAVAGSKGSGSVALRRKDGELVDVDWRAGSTTIAGMPFYVGLNWPATSERAAP